MIQDTIEKLDQNTIIYWIILSILCILGSALCLIFAILSLPFKLITPISFNHFPPFGNCYLRNVNNNVINGWYLRLRYWYISISAFKDDEGMALIKKFGNLKIYHYDSMEKHCREEDNKKIFGILTDILFIITVYFIGSYCGYI